MALMDDEELYADDDTDADFRSAIEAAFPAEEWDDDRLAAMKDAIKLCLEADEAEADEPPEDDGKGKSLLAIAFGAPKKKR